MPLHRFDGFPTLLIAEMFTESSITKSNLNDVNLPAFGSESPGNGDTNKKKFTLKI